MAVAEQVGITGLGTISKESPIPLYFQLKELLRQEIESGRWQPGRQIPPEMELCEAFGISRTVVRQALRELEYDGLLYREQGKGTFVAKPKIGESLVQDLTGFYEEMVARGLTPVTQVLRQEVRPADEKVAHYLQVRPGDEILLIERVRSVGGEPFELAVTYLPYHFCPALVNEDLTTQSLYALLEGKYSLQLSHGRRTIEAVAANQREAQYLGVREGAPMILLDSVSYLKDGRPIEYFHAVHRGDRSRLEVGVVRRRHWENPLDQAMEPSPAISLRS